MRKFDLLAIAQLPEDEQQDALREFMAALFSEDVSEAQREEIMALLERIQELAERRARPN